MPLDKIAIAKNDQLLRRIILWVTVMLYSASLPYVVFFFWCHWKGSDKLTPELESERINTDKIFDILKSVFLFLPRPKIEI